MMKLDMTHADGSLVFALPLPLWGLSKRTGLFSEHLLEPNDPSGADLVAYFPNHQNGINTWYERYTSMKRLSGNLSYTLRTVHRPGKPAPPGKEYFEVRVYTLRGRDTTTIASVYYAASVLAVPCAEAAAGPCTGAHINSTISGAGCSMSCKAPGVLQLDLALPLAAFVVLEVRAVTLSDQLVALGWGTPGRNASAYVFSSGVMDTQMVLNYCAAVQSFHDAAQTTLRLKADDSDSFCAKYGTVAYNGICTPATFPERQNFTFKVPHPPYLATPPPVINITTGR
jgi:hypothetical protein